MADSSPPILPGLKPVMEFMNLSPQQIVKILIKKNLPYFSQINALAQKNAIPLEEIDGASLTQLCKKASSGNSNTSHQGVIAILKETKSLSLEALLQAGFTAPLPLILALDQVQDPGNLGTVARTAWALGCAGIIIPQHNSAGLSPGAMRSSAGALTQLPLCSVPNLARALDSAEEAGYTVLGTASSGQNAFAFSWPEPAILVLGSEEHGIRPGVGKRCQTMLAIPFARKFDSINVAQAGAILMGLCAASHAGI